MQVVKLVGLTSVELEDKINQEIEDIPALDVGTDSWEDEDKDFGDEGGDSVSQEDIMEEIGGEIEDESDVDEDAGHVRALADGGWRASGETPVSRVNATFGLHLPAAARQPDLGTTDRTGVGLGVKAPI